MELRIEGLSKTYPNGTRALVDVDLAVGAGMFGLLGPNGAGKSTLMRIVATLQEPDRGSVRVGDIDALRDHAALRKVLGYLPQEFGFYPRVTAAKQLDYFAILEGIGDASDRAAAVESLLRQTNLWHARDVRVGEFSGGMRQRLGIAVALLGDPKLLIVDEPTAGLDPEERVRFLNMLAELGRDSIVILSTHIVEDVAGLCERMAIIDAGRILLEGEPDRAIAKLSGRVWGRAVAPSEVPEVRARHEVLSMRLSGRRTHVRVLADERPGEAFDPVDPVLEDVYFATLRAGAETRLLGAEPTRGGEAIPSSDPVGP